MLKQFIAPDYLLIPTTGTLVYCKPKLLNPVPYSRRSNLSAIVNEIMSIHKMKPRGFYVYLSIKPLPPAVNTIAQIFENTSFRRHHGICSCRLLEEFLKVTHPQQGIRGKKEILDNAMKAELVFQIHGIHQICSQKYTNIYHLPLKCQQRLKLTITTSCTVHE